ncbi:Polygalacturonase, partial [hydrothermal vent metagenome]
MILRTIKTLFLVLGLFFASNLFAQTNGIFNIVDFGAVSDGNKINTTAIQKAIDKASKNGGVVLIPPGKFITGSLELKSNVTINIMKGATILGSTDLADYEEHIPQLQSYNDVFLRYSLFYAEKQSNISIVGEGTIDGQGAAFTRKTKKKPERYMNRPYVIRFVECKNITVEGVAMQNSAMWMQQYLACEFLTIRGIKVYNHANYNNDMMDIDGCKNVIISDCFGDTDDDGITLKSTSDRITENVTITNCVISSHCNAIKMGTESIGGFKNVTISNIVVKPSESKTKIYGFHGGISGITLGLVDGGILE